MATYKVHIINEALDIDTVIDCNDDQTILEAAEDQELNLPYSCRAGACSSCTGKLVGENPDLSVIDQSDQAFLEDQHLEKGFVLTCVAYPKSDLKIESHAEEDIF
uniref:Ferredoxin n=1 Tax=Chorda asiatica TaxID=1281577 RepID=A0A8F0FA38_9PHAE|nr:ferredoxin [Chorda asiatica]QWK43176.1 ferredoxin [Chorda asiatica]WAM62141.1 ferredoxin [Chorda asiatica]